MSKNFLKIYDRHQNRDSESLEDTKPDEKQTKKATGGHKVFKLPQNYSPREKSGK